MKTLVKNIRILLIAMVLFSVMKCSSNKGEDSDVSKNHIDLTEKSMVLQKRITSVNEYVGKAGNKMGLCPVINYDNSSILSGLSKITLDFASCKSQTDSNLQKLSGKIIMTSTTNFALRKFTLEISFKDFKNTDMGTLVGVLNSSMTINSLSDLTKDDKYMKQKGELDISTDDGSSAKVTIDSEFILSSLASKVKMHQTVAYKNGKVINIKPYQNEWLVFNYNAKYPKGNVMVTIDGISYKGYYDDSGKLVLKRL